MNIYDTLQDYIRSIPRSQLIERLGYHSLKRGDVTIEDFLSAGSLDAWLESGHYDFLYDAKGLLRRLAELSGVESEKLDHEIASAEERQKRIAAMQTPYIFAETHFRRKNEPIFILAFMEIRRRIVLKKKTMLDRPLDEILEEVSEMIRRHYLQNEGRLTVWGKIHAYSYHHIDGSVYLFATDGTLQEVLPKAEEEPKATLSVGGREIPTELLTNPKEKNNER